MRIGEPFRGFEVHADLGLAARRTERLEVKAAAAAAAVSARAAENQQRILKI